MAAGTVRIRLSLAAVIVPLLLFVCVTPLATAGGAWIAVYLVPIAAFVVVVGSGTTATRTVLRAQWLRGRAQIRWDDLRHIEFPQARWAVAVTHSGRRVVLPGVRPPDLPRLVAAAGGKLFLRRPAAQGGAQPGD